MHLSKKKFFSETQLPSNKKFGYFFSFIFFISAAYFLISSSLMVGYAFLILTLLFFLITIINAELLLPFNKLWMRFGLLLGIIISPIVLAIIFFCLFTPYGIVMRLIGRDELRLKMIKKDSHWIKRSNNSAQTDFRMQF